MQWNVWWKYKKTIMYQALRVGTVLEVGARSQIFWCLSSVRNYSLLLDIILLLGVPMIKPNKIFSYIANMFFIHISQVLVMYLNECMIFFDTCKSYHDFHQYWKLDFLHISKSIWNVSALCKTYAPINVMPHHPPPGTCGDSNESIWSS